MGWESWDRGEGEGRRVTPRLSRNKKKEAREARKDEGRKRDEGAFVAFFLRTHATNSPREGGGKESVISRVVQHAEEEETLAGTENRPSLSGVVCVTNYCVPQVNYSRLGETSFNKARNPPVEGEGPQRTLFPT